MSRRAMFLGAAAIALATTVSAPGIAMGQSAAAPHEATTQDDQPPRLTQPARGPAPPLTPPAMKPLTGVRPGRKRHLKTGDGRAPKHDIRTDLLWVSRAFFFPFYLVSEYVVRRPLGAVITAFERNATIGDFPSTPSEAGLIPTLYLDFGYRPVVGIYYFYDNFLAPENALRVAVSTGGNRYLRTAVLDRVPLRVGPKDSVSAYLQIEVDGAARPDVLFWGIGPSSLHSSAGQFEMRSLGVGLRVHDDVAKGAFFESWANGRRVAFADGHCDEVISFGVEPTQASCKTTTLLEQARAGRYALPAGFAKGYGAVRVGARFGFDTRKERRAGFTGEISGENVSIPAGGQHGSFVAYGGSLGGFLDLGGIRRVLGLVLDARFEDAWKHGFMIPFTELLGNKRVDYTAETDPMRGFLPGRLLGTSSLSASLSYEWPIWAYLSGTMQAAVGNVFGDRLKDFEWRRNRFSFIGGVTVPEQRDYKLNAQLGFGTRTFEQGSKPDSVRLIIGGTTGF